MDELIQQTIDKMKTSGWWSDSENEVLQKYGEMFKKENIFNLSAEMFKEFLLIKNNKHWEGIHRQQRFLTQDMNKLRKALSILADDSRKLSDRLYTLFPKNKEPYIKGLGKAVLTPILLIMFPTQCGVWNSKSEAALKELGLFPTFNRGDTFVDRYMKVNEVLNNLADEYEISLWNLDGVLGTIAGNGPSGMDDEEQLSAKLEEEANEYGISDPENFAMEKHLEDFVVTNWDNLPLSKEYELIYEDGDLVSQQYRTEVGPIDILAVDKKDGSYLIIELKKGRTSDAVVGQILRYMTCISKSKKKEVKGLIIVPEVDKNLEYAIGQTKNISVKTYKVKFTLNEAINPE